jgi:hypothetical protein
MGGWNSGPSLRIRAGGDYWIGLSGNYSTDRNNSTFDNKSFNYSDSLNPLFESGKTTSKYSNWRGELLCISERNFYRNLFINPYLSAGFQYNSTRSSTEGQLNYSILCGIGVEPTLKFFDRFSVGVKFGMIFLDHWNDNNTPYTHRDDDRSYYNSGTGEGFQFAFVGNSNPWQTDLVLHWLIR